MSPKPILLWPKALLAVESDLDRPADAFLMVDTNDVYELRKLYAIHRTTPIFDPYPGHGEHRREFADHIAASHHPLHVVGLEACRGVLRALNDPSLARASIEELLAANVAPDRRAKTLFPFAAFRRGTRTWFQGGWLNTLRAAALVFVAAWIGNVAFPGNGLTAAVVAALVFAAVHACLRIRVRDWFSVTFRRGAARSAH